MPIALPKKKAPLKKKKPTVRRKRGKTRFKTGYHHSPKCKNGPAKYRSGWEKTVCEYLDQDDDVLYYEYEPFKLQWCSNLRTGRIRTYIPDFFVVYCDGRKKLVEVKSMRFLNKPHVLKKAAVGKSWCAKNKADYEFWTDQKVKTLSKLLESKKKKALALLKTEMVDKS